MAQVATKKKKIFDGRYEILSIVGRGSGSVVYHARHITAPYNEVALKVLVSNKGKPANADQLRKEALAMVSARHKYTIRLDDFHSVDQLCYLSMEYAPEGDLRRYSQKFQGKLPLLQIERFILQLSEAVAFMHQAGILHRDIKPDNILVVSDRQVRLADFGVAVLPGEESSLTDLQKGVGTMDYMAPEVLQGIECTKCSDVYLLGVTFYELVSGRHPFNNVPLAQVIDARRDENIPSLKQFRPDLPDYLEKIILRAMSFEPALRFPTARQLFEAILVEKSKENEEQALQTETQEKNNVKTFPAKHNKILRAEEPHSSPKPNYLKDTQANLLLDPDESEEDLAETIAEEPKKPKKKRRRRRRKPRTQAKQDLGLEAQIEKEADLLEEIVDLTEPEIEASIEDEVSQIEEPTKHSLKQTTQEEDVLDMDSADIAEPPVSAKPEHKILPQHRKPQAVQVFDKYNANKSIDKTLVESLKQAVKAEAPLPEPTKPAPTKQADVSANIQDIETDFENEDDVSEITIPEKIDTYSGYSKKDFYTSSTEKPLMNNATNDRKKRRWLTAMITIALALWLADDLMRQYTHKSLAQAGIEMIGLGRTALLPPVNVNKLGFPKIPDGLYSGKINGLIKNTSLPVTINRIPETQEIVFTVGLPGWIPARISLENDTNDSSLRVRSSGFVLTFSGVVNGERLEGTFINSITGEEGSWFVTPITK